MHFVDASLDVKWRAFDPKEYDRIGLQVHSAARARINANEGLRKGNLRKDDELEKEKEMEEKKGLEKKSNKKVVEKIIIDDDDL